MKNIFKSIRDNISVWYAKRQIKDCIHKLGPDLERYLLLTGWTLKEEDGKMIFTDSKTGTTLSIGPVTK